MRSRLAEVAALLVVFGAGALAYTWPLVAHLRSGFTFPTPNPPGMARADTCLTSWMLSWVVHALVTRPLHLFDANILYPLPSSFALSENLVAGGLLVLPLDVVHHDPILDHNVLALATFALGGTGAALLVRELGGSFAAAVLGGIFFAFNPFRMATLAHVHALSTHWMPFALLFLHRALRTGRWRDAAAFGGFVLLVELSSIYLAYYFWLLLAVVLGLHVVLRCPVAPAGRRRVVLAALGAALAFVPFLVPYAVARAHYGLARGEWEAFFFSDKGITFVGALLDLPGYLRARYLEGGNPPGVIGLGAWLLIVLGIWRGRAAPAHGGRRIPWLYLGAALWVAALALGPLMQLRAGFYRALPGPHALLRRIVPGFDALRVPVRATGIAMLPVSVVVALGGDLLVGERAGRRRTAALIGLMLVAVTESWRPRLYTLPIAWAHQWPAVYRWLAAQPGDPVVAELPLGIPVDDGLYMLASTYHWRRLMNGYTGFGPATTYERAVLLRFPDAEGLRLLADSGVRYAIVHNDLLPLYARTICKRATEEYGSWIALRYQDSFSCVLEILGAPPAPPRPPESVVGREGIRVRASSGEDPSAVIDGRAETHWTQAVDRNHVDWLAIELPRPHRLTRLVLHFASHFGEYLREYRIEASTDGATWTLLAEDRAAPAPVTQVLHHPSELTQDIPLPGTEVRLLRIVRPGVAPDDPWDLWANWPAWGAHELELFEPAS